MPRNTDGSGRRDKDMREDDMSSQDKRGGRPMRDRMRDEGEMPLGEGMPPSHGARREDDMRRDRGQMRDRSKTGERGQTGDRMRDEDAIPLDEDDEMLGEGYR